MSKPKVVIMDRYSATGTPRPGKDSCKKCEGMGYYPQRCWCAGKTLGHREADPGWCFVTCEKCKGTRKVLQ